jgi:hypothetical protein
MRKIKTEEVAKLEAKLDLAKNMRLEDARLYKEEIKELKRLLSHRPNVCSKCGWFLGLLAESECINCDKIAEAAKLYDALSQIVSPECSGELLEIIESGEGEMSLARAYEEFAEKAISRIPKTAALAEVVKKMGELSDFVRLGGYNKQEFDSYYMPVLMAYRRYQGVK